MTTIKIVGADIPEDLRDAIVGAIEDWRDETREPVSFEVVTAVPNPPGGVCEYHGEVPTIGGPDVVCAMYEAGAKMETCIKCGRAHCDSAGYGDDGIYPPLAGEFCQDCGRNERLFSGGPDS
jgi:hypothetical protein